MNKVLITGSGGFVGKNLYSLLQNEFSVFGIDKIKKSTVDEILDLDDKENFLRVLNSFAPDVIVHLAALSNVEKCETERELAEKQNVYPVEIMSSWADKNGKKIVLISSDYVYDGVKGGYTEKDVENPIQFYGVTKLKGEKIVSRLKEHLILRPTVIYGWDPDGMNFFMQLYRNIKDKKPMKVPVDQISNPTHVSDLCELIRVMLKSNVNGTYIATGNESISRYDFAIKIAGHMGWDTESIIPVKTDQLGQIAKRPLNNSTSNKRVTEEFGFEFRTLEENLNTTRDLVSA